MSKYELSISVYPSYTSEWERKLSADLATVRSLVSSGQIEQAKQLMQIVSANVGSGSQFAKEIGDLFMSLGCDPMAGRFYYLLDNKTDMMLDACKAFEESLGNNPVHIFHAFIFEKTNLHPYAEKRLKELREQNNTFMRTYSYVNKIRSGKYIGIMALLGRAALAFIVLFVLAACVMIITTWWFK